MVFSHQWSRALVAERGYPSTAEGLQALAAPKGGGTPFMNSIPKDAWDHEFVYVYPGSSGGKFDIMSYGPDGVAGVVGLGG